MFRISYSTFPPGLVAVFLIVLRFDMNRKTLLNDVVDSVDLFQMQRVMALEKVVRKLDTDAQLNPQYVNKMAKGSYPTGPMLHDDEGVSIQNFIPGFNMSDMMSLS